MATKPANKIVARASARGEGYAAQYATPGMIPILVEDSSGRVCEFPTAAIAEHAAMAKAIDAFNAQISKKTRSGAILRLSAGELAALLQAAHVTFEDFADMAGVPERRLSQWLSGLEDIPHSVHVLARLIAASATNRTLAEQITRDALELS